MPGDFGDESGEKLLDWMLDIGQTAGQDAMHAAARKLTVALKRVKGDLDIGESSPEWASLNLDELTQVENYDSIKQIIDRHLDDAGVEHRFFTNQRSGKQTLLFRHEDAGKVDRVFEELVDDAQASLEKADQTLNKGSERAETKTKETSRDSEPLEKRAVRTRVSAAALEAERGRGRSRAPERANRAQELRTK